MNRHTWIETAGKTKVKKKKKEVAKKKLPDQAKNLRRIKLLERELRDADTARLEERHRRMSQEEQIRRLRHQIEQLESRGWRNDDEMHLYKTAIKQYEYEFHHENALKSAAGLKRAAAGLKRKKKLATKKDYKKPTTKKVTQTMGERCCEAGVFGQEHKCRKHPGKVTKKVAKKKVAKKKPAKRKAPKKWAYSSGNSKSIAPVKAKKKRKK